MQSKAAMQKPKMRSMGPSAERRLGMTKKKFKEICKCDHCGNESEIWLEI